MRAILERDFLFFASKKRYFVLRTNAVALPLLFMMLLAMSMSGQLRDEIGIALFFTTAYSILLFIIFITPAMLAHVIAEERRNNKLDVLRSSPISAAGIVLGKWLSRVGLIVTLVIAALPLNAAALLFGGISPAGFLKSTLIIFMTVLWVSSLSLFVGATSNDLGHVVRRAYVVVVSLFVLEFALWSLGAEQAVFRPDSPLQWISSAAYVLNPLTLLATEWGNSGTFVSLGMGPVTIHFIVTLLATACLLGASIRSLISEPKQKKANRLVAPEGETLPETSGDRVWKGGRFSRNLPLLWRSPAVWLELRRGASRRKSLWQKILLLSLLGILELIFLRELFDTDSRSRYDDYEVHMVPILICLFMATFVTASLGASSVHRDNEANTRDVLHSTPLANRQLAAARVAGVLSAASFWWLLAMGHAVLALLMGDIHFMPVLGCAVISFTLLVALAAICIVIGMSTRNITRANVLALAMIVEHLFVYPLCIGLPLVSSGASDSAVATGFFLGHHPGYMVWMQFTHFHQFYVWDNVEVWLPPVLYLAGYGLLARYLLLSKLPQLYARLRGDGISVRAHPRRAWRPTRQQARGSE